MTIFKRLWVWQVMVPYFSVLLIWIYFTFFIVGVIVPGIIMGIVWSLIYFLIVNIIEKKRNEAETNK